MDFTRHERHNSCKINSPGGPAEADLPASCLADAGIENEQSTDMGVVPRR